MSAGFDGSTGFNGHSAVKPESGAPPEPAAESKWASVVQDEIQWCEDRDSLIKFDRNHDGHLSRKELRAYTWDYEKRALCDKENLTWSFHALLDHDGDGVLSNSEQGTLHSYLIEKSPLGQLDLSKAKTDDKGNVTLDEFLKAASSSSTMRNAHKTSIEYVDMLLGRYDSNHNKRLDYSIGSAGNPGIHSFGPPGRDAGVREPFDPPAERKD